MTGNIYAIDGLRRRLRDQNDMDIYLRRCNKNALCENTSVLNIRTYINTANRCTSVFDDLNVKSVYKSKDMCVYKKKSIPSKFIQFILYDGADRWASANVLATLMGVGVFMLGGGICMAGFGYMISCINMYRSKRK